MAADPTIAVNRQQIEQQTSAYVAANQNSNTRTVITIPVVFHVLWNTAAENIPDALLIAQIDQLNLDYALLNSDASSIPSAWSSVAANTNIQFCLAVRDPSGNTTTGIERRQTTVTSWSTNNNIKHFVNGGLDAWSSSSYLNLWVGSLGSNLLGYAQFPGGSAATDGVVVLNTSVGSMANPNPDGGSYNFGRTATHEVGHWLNMNHIWGDDGGGCGGSDNVGDTPNQGGENYGCPSYPLTDNCTASSPGVMFMDYMDYTEDACMYMFTSGQATRMNALFATGGQRISILNSLGCTPLTLPVCTSVTAGTISAGATTLCGGSTTTLSLTGNTVGVSGLTYLWEQSSNGTSGWIPATGTNSNVTYTTPVLAGVIWYRCSISCSTAGVSDMTPTIMISAVGIASVSNDSVCVAGNYNLIANGFGNISWYSDAAGTNNIQNGNTLNVTVLGDTIFWVRATSGGANYNTTPVNNSIGTSSLNTTFTNGEVFDALTNLTIDTVFAYPGSTGIVHVNLINAASGAIIATATKTITSGMVGQKTPIPTSFNCVAGTTYHMDASGSTINSGLQRNSNGAVYPYTVAGIISITDNIVNSNGRYYFFYDWQIHTGCSSELIPVNMHIGPLAISSSASQLTICTGNSTTLISTGGSTYTWLPGNLTGSSVSVSPPTTTTYTVTGTIGSGCSGSSTVVINVVPVPVVSITTADDSICVGTQTTLAGTGASTYTWMPGSLNGSSVNVMPTATTTYTLSGSNGGCSASATQIINVQSAVVSAAVQGTSSTICKGTSITINATGLLNYTWTPGGMNTASITVSPIVSTTYHVSGTNAFGCSAQTNVPVTVVNCDGLSEAIETNNILFYPNPVLENVTIEMNNLMPGEYHLTLTNAIGQLLISENFTLNTIQFSKNISMKEFPKGVYFIRATGASESRIQKLMKD